MIKPTQTKRNFQEKYFKDLPGEYNKRYLKGNIVRDGPYSLEILNPFEDIVEDNAYITGGIAEMKNGKIWVARAIVYQLHLKESLPENTRRLMLAIFQANVLVKAGAVKNFLEEVFEPYRARINQLEKITRGIDFGKDLHGDKYLVSQKLNDKLERMR